MIVSVAAITSCCWPARNAGTTFTPCILPHNSAVLTSQHHSSSCIKRSVFKTAYADEGWIPDCCRHRRQSKCQQSPDIVNGLTQQGADGNRVPSTRQQGLQVCGRDKDSCSIPHANRWCDPSRRPPRIAVRTGGIAEYRGRMKMVVALSTHKLSRCAASVSPTCRR